MDAAQLQQLFQSTYSPDVNVRKSSELQLRSLETQEGFPTATLQIIAEGQDLAVNQACAVYLKNRISRSWDMELARPRPNQIAISQTDKMSIKQNILQVLVASTSSAIRVQIANIIGTIVSSDVPEQWPQFLENVLQLLVSQDPREQFAGELALHEILKAWRFRVTKREYMTEIVSKTFPILVESGKNIVDQDSPDAGSMLHIIFKIYKASIQHDLSEHQQQSIVAWGSLFLSVINKDIPAELLADDEEERERSPWFKAKKHAFYCLNRLFARFGSPSQLSTRSQQYKPFANTFVENFAPEILKSYLALIEKHRTQGLWLSSKSKFFIFDFMSECIKPKSTWSLLKPHVGQIVSEFVFPQVVFNQAQAEQFEDDPVEFIRSAVDPLESFNSPSSAATSFLLALTRNRTKSTFEDVLAFVNSVLTSSKSPEEKYGAFSILIALSSIVMSSKKFGGMMESVFVNHVLPEFTSEHAFMRLIACEMVQKYETWDITWSDKSNLEAHFTAVVNAMSDSQLPVRVLAALALTEQIQHPEVKAAMAPNIAKIVQDLLKLSDEIDLDTLSQTMERIVDDFGDELVPFAVDVSRHLGETYMRIMSEQLNLREAGPQGEIDQYVDAGEDKVMAAMGAMKTLQQLVRSLENSQSILREISSISTHLVVFTIQNEFIELYDEVFELVDCLTFFMRAIPDDLWPVFEALYQSFKGSGVDYLSEMLPSLDNFISYGSPVFAQNPTYRQMAIDIYLSAMESDQLGETDRVVASQLIESVLLHLPGQVDDALPLIIGTAMKKLDPKDTHTKALRLHLLETVINALNYNPVISLGILEEANATTTFFNTWMSNIGLFTRVHDKKLVVVGICSLMQLSVDQTPPSVQSGWPALFGGLLDIIEQLPQAIAERDELKERAGEYPEEDEEDLDFATEDIDGADDEGDIVDEENEYLEVLAAEAQRMAAEQQQQGKGMGTDIDDDFDDDDELEEELTFESPLDNFDVFVRFKHRLSIFQATNPAGATAANGSLDQDRQNKLQNAITLATERESQGFAA
ncbi:ARM repeat-containing protein [Wallemia mellicola]|nr:ARM repeat-containing protein [Wallemia mellicola]